MNAWRDGYVKANGIQLHYHRTGGDKPPIVMAHGATDNGLCWSPLVRALEDEYDIIMVDARGHGLSDKPESNYSPQDHAEDLAGVIDALGLQTPILIGHSMGGSSSAFMAFLYPERVSRLILEDPGWSPTEVGATVDDVAMQERRRGMRERLILRKSQPLEQVTAETRRDNPLWSDDEFPAHSEAKHQVTLSLFDSARKPAKMWWEVVPGLRCPTLVLTGDIERGAIITEGMAETIRSLNPQVEVVRLAGAGHNVRREQWPAFLAEVRRFLNEG